MRELYPLLIRMSVGDELPPTIATRHAVAALSHKFLGDQQTAMMHHAMSVSALQIAINGLKTADNSDEACQQKFQAIAASLLLNTFEAGRLEESSRGWGIFFTGSKQIARFQHVPHKTYDGDPALILDWLFYHDTMHKFSLRHWHPQEGRGQSYLASQDTGKVVSKAVFSPMRQIIVLLTGCSIECLDLIHQAIDVVRDRSDPEYLGPSHLAAVQRLEYRLTNLVQILRVTSSPSPAPIGVPAAASESTLENRAELFRLTTLIYLYRVAWNRPHSHPSVAPLIRDGIRLLKRTTRAPPSADDPLEPNGERPFPLFVLGLEARTEGERRVMVDAMDAAARARPLGNVAGWVRRMVFAAWVRADLYGEGIEEGEGEDRLTVYDSLFSGNRMPPFMA
ncbi:fungal-specific transcription factor domain-containing protein [Schizothecium vesticola]|uniref:Fungal-specific transcription factor domain-containing protein n=1 Tax=Schizothecium vesticola TaxID=314040 RepID=A0AA40ENK2_9PEZI|nr:fungal-specific transcription factor domain-containing protein [Schizothecium vesticola]